MSDDFKGCGFSRSDKDYSIHVGKFPNRKRIALYVEKESTIYPLAYFVGEKEAYATLQMLDELIQPQERVKK